MKSIKYLSVLLTVLVVINCSQSVTESVINGDFGQRLFFEVEYMNGAAGYVHKGLSIGDSGELFSYRLSSGDNWISNQKGVYSERKLFEKFNTNKQFVRTIEKEELIQMISLISGASNGTLSKPVGKGDDMGLWKFKSFTYDNAKREYTEVVLRVEGDWFAENTSWQATAIEVWLETQKAFWLESLK